MSVGQVCYCKLGCRLLGKLAFGPGGSKHNNEKSTRKFPGPSWSKKEKEIAFQHLDIYFKEKQNQKKACEDVTRQHASSFHPA